MCSPVALNPPLIDNTRLFFDMFKGTLFLNCDVQFQDGTIAVFLSQFTWANVGYLFHLYAKGV